MYLDQAIKVLNYGNNQQIDPSSRDGSFQVLFIFRNNKSIGISIANIACSLKRAVKYIKQYLITKKVLEKFEDVVKSIWTLINSIYELK